jgi:PAS domain S-box-containing protein
MIADVRYIKAILDNSPESIVLIGKDHEVLAYNETIRKVLFGYFRRNIVLGDKYFPDFVIDGSKALYLETFEKAIRGESITVQHLTENENISIWFEYHMAPVYDETGELIGVTLSANNIDEEKRAELRLIESEDKFKKITTLAPIGIIITNEELGIKFSNYAAQKVFDYTDEELGDKTIVDLIAEFGNLDDKTFDIGNSSVSLGAFQFENERCHGVMKDGQKFDVLLSSSSYLSGNSQYYIFLVQDISDLLKKDATISVQNIKLKEIAWQQSHIIRAPVANILGLVMLLQDNHFSFTDAERQNLYGYLIKSVKRLDEVIIDIVQKSNS